MISDKSKDLYYLTSMDHDFWFVFSYGLTIFIPLIMNFWNNEIQMRVKDEDTRYDGLPKKIDEKKLIWKTFLLEFGLEYEEQKKGPVMIRDPDFVEKRSRTCKNIQLYNNTF